jgi:hypothetical protein
VNGVAPAAPFTDSCDPRVVDPSIDVSCEPAGDGWTCHVTVSEGPSSTTHEVTVSGPDLARLAPGAATPADLVHRSFAFLLDRESKESILRRFDLPVIARYFPEWERTLREG